MPSPVFVAEAGGSRIYKLGRVGYDTGTQDAGGAYTGTLRTEKISPAGEAALCYFRRVALRLWRTGAYTVTVRVYINGAQTQIYDSAGVASDQEIVFSDIAPTAHDEPILEVSLVGQGTYIEVEIEVNSDDVTGVLLFESVEVHYLPIRATKSRSNAEST